MARPKFVSIVSPLRPYWCCMLLNVDILCNFFLILLGRPELIDIDGPTSRLLYSKHQLFPNRFHYYLRNKKVSTYNISSFIDKKMNRNQLRIHEYLLLASLTELLPLLHQRSSLQGFLKYFGVMAFQTFLGIFSSTMFILTGLKRINKS